MKTVITITLLLLIIFGVYYYFRKPTDKNVKFFNNWKFWQNNLKLTSKLPVTYEVTDLNPETRTFTLTNSDFGSKEFNGTYNLDYTFELININQGFKCTGKLVNNELILPECHGQGQWKLLPTDQPAAKKFFNNWKNWQIQVGTNKVDYELINLDLSAKTFSLKNINFNQIEFNGNYDIYYNFTLNNIIKNFSCKGTLIGNDLIMSNCYGLGDWKIIPIESLTPSSTKFVNNWKYWQIQI